MVRSSRTSLPVVIEIAFQGVVLGNGDGDLDDYLLLDLVLVHPVGPCTLTTNMKTQLC